MIASIFLSCAPKSKYNYHSISYESPELALVAQKTEYNEFLSRLSPTKRPIGGSVIIVVPTIAYNEKNFVFFTGSEPSETMKARLSQYDATETFEPGDIKQPKSFATSTQMLGPSETMREQMSHYIATLMFNANKFEGEAIEKRRIFDKVTFVSNDNPENSTFNEDFALLYFKKDGMGRWFLKRKKDTSKLINIEAISTALPPLQRMALWLDNVEKATKSE